MGPAMLGSVLLLTACNAGRRSAPAVAAAAPPAMILPGFGHLRHIIRTSSPEAQAFFDQGLTFVYAFNFLEAVHSFQRAASLDPSSPMPWWGIALARGPNFNGTDISPARELLGYRTVQKATALLAGSPPEEQALVRALAQRFKQSPLRGASK